MSVQLVILIIYMVALLAVSWYSTRLMNRSADKSTGFFLGGRGIPWFIVAALLIGTAVGGTSTVGVAEQAYTNGLSAFWYDGAWGIGAVLTGIFFARHMRKWRKTTVPEIMGDMFGAGARYVSVIAMIVFMLIILGLQFIAGGTILQSLLPNIFHTQYGGMILSAIVFVIITLIGGMWASGLSNLICVIVIYIGLIVAVAFAIPKFGGWAAIVKALPPSPAAGASKWAWGNAHPGMWLSLCDGIGFGAVIGYIGSFLVQGPGAQSVAQVVFSAKNGRQAQAGTIIGGILMVPAGIFCAVFGLIAAAAATGALPIKLDITRANLALPQIMMHLPPVVGGILLAALWAADISTAVGILMAVASMGVNDVIKKIWTIDHKYDMIMNRVGVIVAAVLGLLLSLTVIGMVKTLTAAMSITASYFVFFLANIYFPKLLKKRMGFWMIILSLIFFVFWMYTPVFNGGLKYIFAGQLSLALIVLNVILFIIFAIFAKEPANVMKEFAEDD